MIYFYGDKIKIIGKGICKDQVWVEYIDPESPEYGKKFNAKMLG